MNDVLCQLARVVGAAAMGAGLYGIVVRRLRQEEAGGLAGTVARLQADLQLRTAEARDAETERDRLRAALARASAGPSAPDKKSP